jgi:hypothetical protein
MLSFLSRSFLIIYRCRSYWISPSNIHRIFYTTFLRSGTTPLLSGYKNRVFFIRTVGPVLFGLISFNTEGWTTRQVDYTNTSAQADIKEEIYVEYPRLFGSKFGTSQVLHLTKSLYGLQQAPCTFFGKSKAGLEERGW